MKKLLPLHAMAENFGLVSKSMNPKLKIQQLQDILAEQWKPYMQNLDTMYTDATC